MLQSSFVLIWGERRINKQIGGNLIRVNGDGLGFCLLLMPFVLQPKQHSPNQAALLRKENGICYHALDQGLNLLTGLKTQPLCF